MATMQSLVTKSNMRWEDTENHKKWEYRLGKDDAFHRIAHETKAHKDESIFKFDQHHRRYPLNYSSIGVSCVPTTNQLVATDY